MHDSITNMYYLRARYYVPETGRFTQADTYHGDGLNLYVYTRNNPIKYVDPSGHICKSSGIESSLISKVGDFTDLKGSTVDEILDRIPDEAILRELKPVDGGATEGFEFKWNQNNQTYRVRVHNQDPSAPVGSNAYNGWVVRVQKGRRFYDYTINDFREAKYTNPTGDYFDEVIMNNTHIPIKDPYK